jgi:hypothetical protein
MYTVELGEFNFVILYREPHGTNGLVGP